LENEIVFSTFQTAKENIDIQRQFNIILIDEAHHLSAETYQEIFQKFYKPI
jgi:superfamily II DNA or RNA helicase